MREALKLIADIASGSTTANSLQNIAKIAQEALAQPEQEPVGYVQTVIEALYENGDPISVDAAELLQRISAQPEQEPVAFICQGNVYMADDVDEYCTATHIPLYTKEQL